MELEKRLWLHTPLSKFEAMVAAFCLVFFMKRSITGKPYSFGVLITSLQTRLSFGYISFHSVHQDLLYILAPSMHYVEDFEPRSEVS